VTTSEQAVATAVPGLRHPAEGRWARIRRSEASTAMLFLIPSLVGFVLFYLYPTIRGVYLSLTDFNILRNSGDFIGLQNYRDLLGDLLFWNALWVTLKYVFINIAFQTVLALGIAVLMDRLTQSAAIRGMMVLPWLIPNVVVALLWLWMLDPSLGVVNSLLQAVGLPAQEFLGSKDQVIPSIAGINIWRHMGYTALLLFAGLQTIPRTVYEAGSVDGASEWKMFWHITIPLLRPVLALVLVVTMIGSFQIFDTVAVATRGDPANASRVIYYYIFQQAFEFNNFGYAAAMAVVLLLILLLVTLVQMRLLRAGESDLA
jgi:multiple sugar transport system permease protein